MKKLSFFLMAMLFSVMSFAAEATATISFANKAQRTEYSTSKQVWEQNGIVVTNEKASSTSNVGDYCNPARFYKSSKVTIQCTLGNIKKIEISGCGANDKTTPWNTNGDAVVNGTSATITPKSTSDTYTIASLNGQARAGQMVVTYEVSDEGFVATPAIEGEQYFKESATVSMKATEGLKVYYTLDGTEPTTASTEYAAPFEVTETTTVKAIAHDGENASEVVTVVFKKMQVLTCVEAAGLCKATESADKYVVRGYVTELVDGGYNATYNNTNLWMADTKNGGQVLQAFRLIPVSNVEKTLVVGDYVEAIGSLVLWSDGTKEIKNGSIEKIVAPAEPEIEWMEMDLEITNLVTEVMEVEGAKFLQLMGRNDAEDADVTLFLNNYADVDDDYVVNAGSSYMTFGGTELTVLEGTMTQTSETEKGTIYTGTVRASAEEEGETMYLEFTLTMYAAPATVLVLTDAIVAINEELGTLTFNVPTGEGEDEGYYAELANYTAPGVHQGPQICLFATPEVVSYTNYAETSVADGVITLKGEFTSPMGPKFDLTISGTLPVVEPEVIAYELNGGELVVEVPTQEELWASFKTAAGLTTLGTLAEITEAGAGKPHNEQDNPCACRIICAKLLDANVNAIFALPEWAWLKAYIMTVQSGLPEASSAAWRYAIAAFFLQSQHSAYPTSADYTEAGKPEAWGAAYQAAHAVVLPTEPVDAPYTLPTPVKEGYKFVGWYDNAEGKDDPYTVIPAGWSGTLYAIWEVQGPTTALDNIAIEGKVVKTIINGQLIIVKNGVQYNAQGQVIK